MGSSGERLLMDLREAGTGENKIEAVRGEMARQGKEMYSDRDVVNALITLGYFPTAVKACEIADIPMPTVEGDTVLHGDPSAPLQAARAEIAALKGHNERLEKALAERQNNPATATGNHRSTMLMEASEENVKLKAENLSFKSELDKANELIAKRDEEIIRLRQEVVTPPDEGPPKKRFDGSPELPTESEPKPHRLGVKPVPPSPEKPVGLQQTADKLKGPGHDDKGHKGGR